MSRIKAVFTTTFGNAIEYYDITLYGFFAVYLSPLFFPADNLFTSQLASLAAFAVGFLARPLGGIIFGHIGDRYGRKKALVLAILLVTIPTTTMGILPSYSSIGVLAPLILVFCRLLQGICTGGEYSGAAVFLSEHYRHEREGFACSLLPTSSLCGALLGTSLAGICLLPQMPPWAWRIPFLMGGVFGLIGYMLRNTLKESPEFLGVQEEKRLVRLPLLEVIKQDKRSFLGAFWISAYNLVLFYIPVVYIVHFMTPKEMLASLGMLLNTGFMALLIVLFPLMGLAADRFGKERIMMGSIIAALILAFPLFLLIIYDNSLSHIFIVLMVFACLSGAFVAPSVSFLPRLFPVRERYSALAIAVGLGEAFGGMTPLICHGFVGMMGTPLAPAFYLLICAFLGGVAILYSKNGVKMDSATNNYHFKSVSP